MKSWIVYTRPADGAQVMLQSDAPEQVALIAEPIEMERGLAYQFTIDETTIPDGWGATLIVARKGYVPVQQRGLLFLRGPDGVRFCTDDYILVKEGFPRSHLPKLVVHGQVFMQEDGAHFTGIECSDFNMLARFLCNEDIAPILKQRAALGFNLLRVWTLMDLEQYGIGKLLLEDHPELYDRIPEFLDYVASFGLRVEFTAYTGVNDPLHWQRLCDASKRSQSWPLIEAVNELDQNTNEPDHLGRVYDPAWITAPGEGLLCSRGSNGSQAQPVAPFLDYVTFHTNGASEEQRKVGHNAMEIWEGPSLTNETSRFSGQSLTFAYDAAAGAALLCAGSCCHTPNGKKSALWEGPELAYAAAWAAGAREVPLQYQDGLYLRHDDPAYLRVYERRLPSDGWVVKIRF